MSHDRPSEPFFLIVADYDRGLFSVEGPMTDDGALRTFSSARKAMDWRNPRPSGRTKGTPNLLSHCRYIRLYTYPCFSAPGDGSRPASRGVLWISAVWRTHLPRPPASH